MTPGTQQVDVTQIEMDTITMQVQVTHQGTTGATDTRKTGVITIWIDVNIDIASRDKIVTIIEMIEAETETMTVITADSLTKVVAGTTLGIPDR